MNKISIDRLKKRVLVLVWLVERMLRQDIIENGKNRRIGCEQSNGNLVDP